MFSAVIPIKKADFQFETIKLNGESLLDKKLYFLSQLSMIKEIIIATDILSLEEYKSSRIKFIFRDALNIDSICYLSNCIADVASCEHIMWTHCTTPFISNVILQDVIDKYLSLDFGVYDSLITCKLIQGLILDDNGPLNFYTGKDKLDSRKLARLYQVVGGCFIASKCAIVKHHHQWGVVPYKYIVDKEYVFDIKDKKDFEIYNAMVSKDF